MLKIAFKEWAVVCRAIGEGRQTVILRKGGIAETGGVFRPEHDRFWLYPTHFHEQTTHFPWSPPAPVALSLAPEETHTIEFLAEVESKHQITGWEAVRRLADLHFWTEDTLRERFDYSEATGISLAFLRVFRLSEPWTFPDEKKFGGCRSWLDLPPPPENGSLTPVLDDTIHAARRSSLAVLLAGSPAAEHA